MSIFRAKKTDQEIFRLKKAASGFDLPAKRNLEIKARVMSAIKLVPQDSAVSSAMGKNFAKNPLWLPKLAFSVLAGVGLLGSTVFASSYSLPGDVLYPVKKAKEKLELQLAPAGRPKALVLVKQAEERLHELSDIKAIPTQPGNTEKLSKQKEEARVQANIQVSTAVESLAQVKKDLEDKGNTQAAESVNSTIVNLVARAKTEDVEVEDRIGASGEKQEKAEERQQDSPKEKEGQEKVKRPEGEVRGLRHKAGDPDSGKQSRSQEVTLPKVLMPSLTASSGVTSLPNVLPQGQVLGASTTTSTSIEPQHSSSTSPSEKSDDGMTEAQKKLLEQQKEAQEKSGQTQTEGGR